MWFDCSHHPSNHPELVEGDPALLTSLPGIQSIVNTNILTFASTNLRSIDRFSVAEHLLQLAHKFV